MNRISSVLATLALATGAGSLAACASDDPTPDPFVDVDQATLEAAEAPADLVAPTQSPLVIDGAAVRFAADPTLSADGDVEALMRDPRGDRPAPRFARDAIVAIRWGYFPPRDGDLEVVDWSGAVAVSRGAVEVIRPLRFENDGHRPLRPGEDAVRHDDDPRVVRFTSHTLPAWDGLLLRVHRDEVRPAVLVIRLGDLVRVLPFEELFDLDAAETVDAAGHELRIRAMTPRPACADEVGHGRGVWGASPIDDDRGLLAGRLETAGDVYALRARTLDIRGPYGLFRGGLAEAPIAPGTPPSEIDPVARAGGYYAAFHYAPGGILVGRLRSPDEALRGALLGRWLPAADLPAEVDLPAGADAGFRAVMLQRDPACASE